MKETSFSETLENQTTKQIETFRNENKTLSRTKFNVQKDLFSKTNLKIHNADNPSKFWGTIKNIFPVKCKSSDLPKSFKIGNKLTNDKVKIANGFCKFFSTVASSLKRKSYHFMELVWRPSFKAVNYIVDISFNLKWLLIKKS